MGLEIYEMLLYKLILKPHVRLKDLNQADTERAIKTFAGTATKGRKRLKTLGMNIGLLQKNSRFLMPKERQTPRLYA